MIFKLSKSKLFTLLCTAILFIGVQDSVQAQVQVFNFTGCTITVYVGQNDLSTVVPCDLCPINPPSPVVIGPGGNANIFGQDVCGEEAGWIAWQVAGSAGFGLSPNPGLLAACVPNALGPLCGAPTNAFWAGGGGTGFVTVFIF